MKFALLEFYTRQKYDDIHILYQAIGGDSLHVGPFTLMVDCVDTVTINADETKMRLNETFAWDSVNPDSWKNFTIAGVSTS